MSELLSTRHQARDMRWHLLGTSSALVLSAFVASAANARAEDGDRATLWIELGGQMERIDGGEAAVNPGFLTENLSAPFNLVPPLSVHAAPRLGFSGEGKITLAPKGTDWVFSAAARFGRTNGFKEQHQQTTQQIVQTNGRTAADTKYRRFYRPITSYNHTEMHTKESHTIVDFKVGKDVGLGMFGNSGTSTVSLGLRIAQFTTQSDTLLRSAPDPYYPQNFKYATQAHLHRYYARAHSDRNFRGIGPSITWEGAAAVAGDADTGGVTFDWGVNAALLFGRQKASGNHMTTGRYFMGSPGALPPPPTAHYVHSTPFSRSRSKIVPNVGGFAGLSARYSHAKFSLGYRGDFFFGAMDGGIDTRETRNRSFHGPFATIAIGVGG